MLRPQKQVFFLDTDNNEYPGLVLGAEADYIWLLVPTLGCTYQGHPDTVANFRDRKVFWLHDRCKPTKALFNVGGQFNSDIFWHAKDPEPMKKLLQAFKIVQAHGL